MKTLFGCDPELFLVDAKGSFVSSINKIGGSKAVPRDIGRECKVQEDNVAVEFNIPPCDNKEAFINHIEYSLAYIKEYAQKFYDLELKIVPSAEFSDKELSDPAAQAFGCEPDFNAWTLEMNPPPRCDNHRLRSAGGHVHISTGLDKIQVVRACDIALGLWSVTVDPDNRRRMLYGGPGAFRDKPYGVEYRTLSNFWIQSRELIGEVWDRSIKALNLAAKHSPEDFEKSGGDIQLAISTGNVALAKSLMTQYNV